MMAPKSVGAWTDKGNKWFDIVPEGNQVHFWANGEPIFAPSKNQLIAIRDCLTKVIDEHGRT